MTAPAHPPGVQHAACRADPDAMFPRNDNPAGIEAAKAICDDCPIFFACRAWSLDVARADTTYDLIGVWGGLSEIERDYELAVRDECCTARGHALHRSLGEKPCPGCRRAKRRARDRGRERSGHRNRAFRLRMKTSRAAGQPETAVA
jgi:hypothetical protein